jgi:Suppressor of fused protein (SUFU)
MRDELDWEEAYLDHYSRCFGRVASRGQFTPHQPGPEIEVLEYANVMRGCRLYVSCGLARYSTEVGSVGEALACSTPDHDWPYILASALFYVVNARMELGWGMVVGGLEVVAPEFVTRYGKPALYFSRPTLFPKHVRRATLGDQIGEIYLATPISQTEREYFTSRGAVEFETMLASSGVDTLELGRPSAI